MAARSFPNPKVASATLRERKSKIKNNINFINPITESPTLGSGFDCAQPIGFLSAERS
ncbi:MAG: hypothetical protein HC827_04330 [Cyanobacteria bacterium RM1_2_2]|nr:hypothetical protein [Cyanobacteria bacterium RM1_2_2]